ncbi:hypothetical protein ACH4D5_32765 [Streptomyces sp. NPDC018029]|uniref:hypothetical protein n=1 Tax=Streptomyces sp. NPDC018029 TaxID=3365032 RepID=UPI00378E5D1F
MADRRAVVLGVRRLTLLSVRGEEQAHATGRPSPGSGGAGPGAQGLRRLRP